MPFASNFKRKLLIAFASTSSNRILGRFYNILQAAIRIHSQLKKHVKFNFISRNML